MRADTGNPDSNDAMRSIAAAPPQFTEGAMRAVLLDHYGLGGELQPLLSERDQNCLLVTPNDERFVLKIANAAEDPVVTDFQVRALLHIEARGCPIATPRIVPTQDREVSVKMSDGGTKHVARVVTFIPGETVAEQLLDEQIAYAMGVALAEIHGALAGFAHAGDCQPLLWDMQRAPELRPLLQHVTDAGLRAAVSDCIDEFEAQSLPYLQSSRRQVIHGDLNPGNVLLAGDNASIAGVIDFGDMVRAPIIADLAIAASYLRWTDTDSLALIASMIAGYDSVNRLAPDALDALHGMIRTRLATSITLLRWRLNARGDGDAYSEASAASEGDAAQFLDMLGASGKQRFLERVLQAIDR